MMRGQSTRDQLSADSANKYDQESGATKRTEPRTNVFGSAWLSTLDLPLTGLITLKWGKIVDLVPMMNAYKVHGENGSVLICNLAGLTGFQPSGVRQTTTLPVGASVIYSQHDQSETGLILAVEPDYTTDPRFHRSDFIVQGGRTGLYVDPAHDAQLSKLLDRGGIPCFTAGRPMDSTGGGEWGHMAETGLGIHLDPFLGYFRVDEETGLFIFYHDQLSRLAGHNLQLRSSVREIDELDDQQELILISGTNPYTWERTGVWKWCDTNFREINPEIIQTVEPAYSVLEPLFNDQQPFNRVLDFSGYLGQAHKHMVCLPPEDATGINRYSQQRKYLGVLNIQEALDGAYALESSKQVYISKRSCIPVPKMIFRPEDELGDSELDYKAAGKFGPVDGEEHLIKDRFETGASSGPIELVRAAAMLDMGAFTFNWQGLHPFHYHRKDWYVPEECDMTEQPPISFCVLQVVQYLSAPTAVQQKVDDRYGYAYYYPNESYFVLMEDGGVVLSDGFGSELRMQAGSITWYCPGDFNVLPGRNFNVWAGWDAILRANNSADVTANRGDVRLKGEHNVQILGGNDTFGGVLIESKADYASYNFTLPGQGSQHSGITLIARDSPIATLSSDLALATRTSEPGSGNIWIRAGDFAENDIKMYCRNLESFIGQARFDFLSTTVVNEYWPAQVLFGTSVAVNGELLANRGLAVKGWIDVVDGHIATSQAATWGGLVARGAASNASINRIAPRETYLVGTLRPIVISPAYQVAIDAAIDLAEFSLRTTIEYKTSGFLIFEGRWQQMARLSQIGVPGLGIPGVWTELPVITDTWGDMYPHPGDAWINNSWYEQDLTLHSIQNGASIDRSINQPDYENPEYGQTWIKVLDGNFPIINSM